MSDIFISYASEDRAEIEKLAHALESQGMSVWWDRSIPIGQSYARVIESALDEALCIIVIWSKISVNSEWVLAEVSEARSQGKLFPLNIDGSRPPLVYRNLQTADFSHWSGATTDPVFEQIMADIRLHIGESIEKKTFDSEVNEKTSPSSEKLIQAVSSDAVAVSDSEQAEIKYGVNSYPKVEENQHDKEVTVVKVEHSSENKKATLKASSIPSQAPPPKAADITNVQKTGGKKESEKIIIKPETISQSNQAALVEKNPKHVKWIAVIVLLSILIGSAKLLHQKQQHDNYATLLLANNDTNKPQAEIGISTPPKHKITKNILEPEMITIPQGCFLMGSPDPDDFHQTDESLHALCMAKAFKMGKYEVSFDEYDQFCNATDCQKPGDEGWGRGTRPIINVSWKEATAYAEWLSNVTKKNYRLPTEAEWEYAARGNMQPQKRYPWGDKVGNNKANCDGCDSEWDNKKTAPVGSFAANDFGLYDTAGNVWEWTCSSYEENYNGSEKKCGDKRVPGQRVIHGGSWYNFPRYARSASRSGSFPSRRSYDIGFRLAQD